MFQSFTALFFCAAALLGALLTGAAPLRSRQAGDFQCNLDRLLIVTDLNDLQKTLTTLSGEACDATTNATIQGIQTDITGAQTAIGVILQALVNNEDAPADARDQVGGNLTLALGPLFGLNFSDPTAAANLVKAQTQFNNSVLAGNGVILNCN